MVGNKIFFILRYFFNVSTQRQKIMDDFNLKICILYFT